MAAASVVVAGAMASKLGNGGEAWVRSSWVRGLRSLGFDVTFLEEVMPAARLAGSPEAEWFAYACDQTGIADAAVLLAGDEVVGAESLDAVRDLVARCSLLVNISGNLRRSDLLPLARRRAYVDLDPGFTQIWHAQGIGDLRLEDHHVHFSVGANVGTSACPIPTAGLRWFPVRQPVLLDDWQVSPIARDAPFTTVATWRCAFGPVAWGGVDYGLKLHEFRKLVDLPRRVDATFELALAMHDADLADRDRFEGNGWRVRDASEVVADPMSFRDYVVRSAGEVSATQGVYAHAATGWFSDRSARYLACGRPVIVQETDLERSGLPVGEGIVTFTDVDSAVRAVESVSADVQRHADAARRVASDHFEASAVLRSFVERALA